MKRPSFLAHHLRDTTGPTPRKSGWNPKWLALYSIAVTVLALDLGWLHWQASQNDSSAILVRSTAQSELSHAIRDPQESVKLLWRQESQSGIKVNETDGKLSFCF